MKTLRDVHTLVTIWVLKGPTDISGYQAAAHPWSSYSDEQYSWEDYLLKPDNLDTKVVQTGNE